MRLSTSHTSWAAALLLLGTLSACDSGGGAPTGGSDGASADVASTLETLMASASVAVPTDPAINTNDTYVVSRMEVVSEATVYSTVPVYDALTDRTTTTFQLAPTVEQSRVESGYTPAGELVMAEYRLDPLTDPTTNPVGDARVTRGIGSTHAVYDEAGRVISLETLPEVGALESPMASFADLGGVLTDGVVLNELPQAAAFGALGAVEVAGMPGRVVATGRDRFEVVTTAAEIARASGDPEAAGKKGEVKRKYKAQKDADGAAVYVLEEIEVTDETEFEGGRIASRERMSFSGLSWKNNKDKDKERKDKKERNAQAIASLQAWSSNPVAFGASQAFIDLPPPIDDPSGPGGGGSGGSGGTGGGADPCAGKPLQNVVFQHGINSSADNAWGPASDRSKTRGLLSNTFCFGSVVAPDQPLLGVLPSLGVQSDILELKVKGTSKDQFVFISHSQGGLIARNAAQDLVAENKAGLVKGVVTIGTPHKGAYFAQVAENAIFNTAVAPGAGTAICGQKSTSAACRIFAPLIANAAFNFVLKGIFPVSQDTAPGSAFTTKLNKTSEASFKRYGVQHFPKERWMIFRLAGDAGLLSVFGVPPGKGQAWVNTTEWAYRGFRIASVVTFFLGLAPAAKFCNNAANIMDKSDRWYDRVTSPGMEGDGIIQGPSQIYPGANRQFTYKGKDAVSHAYETQSTSTRKALDTILRYNLDVTPR